MIFTRDWIQHQKIAKMIELLKIAIVGAICIYLLASFVIIGLIYFLSNEDIAKYIQQTKQIVYSLFVNKPQNIVEQCQINSNNTNLSSQNSEPFSSDSDEIIENKSYNLRPRRTKRAFVDNTWS